MAIIEVKRLTKEYQLGSLTSFKDTIRHGLARIAGKETWHRERFKALDDVSFSVEQGEVVGIIGHNGAGKSTLLKHLANITKPTTGEVHVRGSVAPLIEVGAGLNPELTGRENIYLNGAILGMPKKEIDNRLDEIIDFSELEQFIDTPVKRYSSGMTVKLGFSIATSIDADILIVDEVLAVGDIAFQRKCLNRMENLINDDGRTVLIVGHNIRQLERICSRMILLKHGRIELDGKPGKVSKLFLDETTLNSEHIVDKGIIKPDFDSGDIELRELNILNGEINKSGVPHCFLFGDLHLRLDLYSKHDFEAVEINIGLHNPEMVFMVKSSTSLAKVEINIVKGNNVIDILLPRLSLCPGTYGIGFAIYDWSRRALWAGNQLTWLVVETLEQDASLLPQSTMTYSLARWKKL